MKRLTLIAFAIVSIGAHQCAIAADKPNIILIMADDFGYECVAANGGHYNTPHLDQMAANGMRFEHCYVQPLCTPTRVQVMTGLYNVRNYFSFGKIDTKATTFAHLLKDAGYATAVAGKWQLGRAKNLPQHLGFDESALWQHTRRPPRYANPGLEYNGEEKDFTDGEYGPALINDFAVDFIARHKDEPFFLYYPMIETHAPFQPTPDSADWEPKARGEKLSDGKHYGEMITYADKMVGRIESTLEKLGIRDNTLIIFCGDNGTSGKITSQFKGQDYRGGKGQATMRGMHVPLIVSWPGKVKGESINPNLVASTDFLPTICEAAGVRLPDSMPKDGHSFYAQLLGEKTEPRESLYCWYARGKAADDISEFAMTKERKLYRGGRFFDLVADPQEKQARQVADLQGTDGVVALELQAVLDQYADARPSDVKRATANAAAEPQRERPRRRRGPRQRAARANADQP